ncbi:hypothetical protein ABKN59_007709 [Abortiporus biennis]
MCIQEKDETGVDSSSISSCKSRDHSKTFTYRSCPWISSLFVGFDWEVNGHVYVYQLPIRLFTIITCATM